MLSLTTKYALRALEHLASREDRTQFFSIKLLAQQTHVAGPYLAKIMKSLAARGIVESRKGPTGGVRLFQDGRSITLFDVALCLDDPITKESCFLSRNPCDLRATCQYHSRWVSVRKQVIDFLKQTVV